MPSDTKSMSIIYTIQLQIQEIVTPEPRTNIYTLGWRMELIM